MKRLFLSALAIATLTAARAQPFVRVRNTTDSVVSIYVPRLKLDFTLQPKQSTVYTNVDYIEQNEGYSLQVNGGTIKAVQAGKAGTKITQGMYELVLSYTKKTGWKYTINTIQAL